MFFLRMCIGPLPEATKVNETTWYTFPIETTLNITFDLEFQCNKTCIVHVAGIKSF